MRQRMHDAIPHARNAINQSPDVAYFYYIISLTTDHELGLRFAKKGLRCKNALTPFVKLALLRRSVEHAVELGLTVLQEARINVQKWEEGLTFLMCAWEDARTFVMEAPPDSRNLKNIVDWYILLTFTVKGPEVKADMGDLNVRAYRPYSSANNLRKLVGCLREAENQRRRVGISRTQTARHSGAPDASSNRNGLREGAGRVGRSSETFRFYQRRYD
jgi:hypothetical protein